MPEYLAPSVFAEEQATGRAISGRAMHVAGFLGRLPKGATWPEPPVPVVSFTHFLHEFDPVPRQSVPLVEAVEAFFANGGKKVFVAPIQSDGVTPDDLDAFAGIDEISVLAAPGCADRKSHEVLISHSEDVPHRFVVLDGPQKVSDAREFIPLTRPIHGRAALYTPWIKRMSRWTRQSSMVGPSAAVCGIYARVDAQCGLFKAPANEGVQGAIGLSDTVSQSMHTHLNAMGINVLRSVHGGVRVMGARTLAEPASDWKYVPVRRYATMLTTSVEKDTAWAVFEPNGRALWRSLRESVQVFLRSQFMSGALQGASEREALFVKCGPDTMTQSDLDAERVVLEFGVALLKPAEFLVFRVAHQTAG